jgi:hypothetical protein
MTRFLRPKYFFLGIVFSFLFCCIAGYVVSLKARFSHFTRFTSYISTSLNYFPLASELLVTAQHNVDKNKVLVLLGGSSIFRGDGQNEDDLWSQNLQQQLGDKYKVLNYGYNGASFDAFGGVAFRILNEHFPKMIFVSTCSYSEDADIDGGKTYGYLFWDGYYKHLFHLNADEKQKMAELRHRQLKTPEGVELHTMSYLDSVFYFRNLWNWVSYRYVFTVYDKNTYPNTFRARRKFPDDKLDNEAIVARARADNDRFASERDGLIKSYYHHYIDPTTHRYVATEADRIKNLYEGVFDPRYRSKTLCYVSPYNPRHLSAIPKNDQESYYFMIDDTSTIIKSLGYHAIRGKGFSANDYVDIMHYVASGGNKLASQIAPEVEVIAKEKGYI